MYDSLFSDEDIRKVLQERNISIPGSKADLASKEIGDRVFFLYGEDKDYYIVIDKEPDSMLVLVNPKNNYQCKTHSTLVKVL
ncbi:MAG: hypothetical protein WC333_02070 [Dehalococcoidia bacterium]|jgi:hypothetical protein